MSLQRALKVVLPILVLAVAGLSFLTGQMTETEESPKQIIRSREKKSAETRSEYLEERSRFEFRRLKDPRTGQIPRGIRQRVYAFADRMPRREQLTDHPENLNLYTSLGPTNLGGRTRAFAFDKRNANIRLSGGVSTGIFRTANGGTTWTNVTPSGEIHNIVSIAQDPRTGSEDTWYYGTGEALGNSASLASYYFGNGIYKSTDNGLTWSVLASTTGGSLQGYDNVFDLVHRIAVDPTNGHVYAAGQRSIMRSTNGGSDWSLVLGEFGGNTNTGLTEVVITTGGRLYAAFAGDAGNNSAFGEPGNAAMDGVWTSTTGAAGSWTKILGSGAATPGVWKAAGTYGRIVLALAPSNQNILYVLYDNKTVSNCSGTPAPEAHFFKWNQATTSAVDRSANLPDEGGCTNGNDPFAIQGGYDLSVAVKPDDENFVVIGGTTAHRSTDGFATTGNTTRIGGYENSTGYGQYPNHHADVHTLVFHPTNFSTLVSGDDGGIQETDVTATPVVWTSLNNNYVTYQYYYVTLSAENGTTNYMGGLQDNGIVVSTGSPTQTLVNTGDGCSVGISASNTWHFFSTQNGNIYKRAPAYPANTGIFLKPAGSGSGVFVTLFYLNPDNTEHLYYASSKALYRTTSASTVDQNTWTLMTAFNPTLTGNITVIRTSRDTYSTSHKLYIGTEDGKVYRLNDPANAAANATPTEITGASFPAGAYVSDISVDPADDRKIMVTFANYNVVSIWYTADASVGSPTWVNIEGNLTIPSVQSCMIVARTGFPTEYYAGTDAGLYSTTALNGGSTTWVMEGPGTIGKAIVRSMAYRWRDNTLLIGTHGNGMFITTVPDPLPVQLASFTGTLVNNMVRLNWRTLSELNNYGFHVQRKLHGESEWSELPNGFIPGHGTTNEPHDYVFVDNTTGNGTRQYRLKQVDLDGTPHYSDPITVDVVTGVDGPVLPVAFQLQQNYPNPFNPTTTIRYALEQASNVVLEVFNTLGERVSTLVQKKQEAGHYSVVFNSIGNPSGIYYYRLTAGTDVIVKKMLLMK